MSAPITATELAEMKVDAERGDLSSKDSLRLIAEVWRLRDELTRQATMHGGVYIHDAEWQPEDLR